MLRIQRPNFIRYLMSKRKIDPNDLLAMEDSFGEDDSWPSSDEPLVTSTQKKPKMDDLEDMFNDSMTPWSDEPDFIEHFSQKSQQEQKSLQGKQTQQQTSASRVQVQLPKTHSNDAGAHELEEQSQSHGTKLAPGDDHSVGDSTPKKRIPVSNRVKEVLLSYSSRLSSLSGPHLPGGSVSQSLSHGKLVSQNRVTGPVSMLHGGAASPTRNKVQTVKNEGVQGPEMELPMDPPSSSVLSQIPLYNSVKGEPLDTQDASRSYLFTSSPEWHKTMTMNQVREQMANAHIEQRVPPLSKTKPLTRNSELFLLTQKPDIADVEDGVELPKTVSTLILSDEQEHVIEMAKKGLNIFYTGSAGTGKSVLLKMLIKTLKHRYGHNRVAVTASTGLAACNIGGITLHSFAGIGLGKGTKEDMLKKAKKIRKTRERWRKIDALIIDEISMVNGELLDKLDYIARELRMDDKPFGGIQLIICGDFFQLPPVVREDDPECMFAFESDSWKSTIQTTIILQKVFRQRGDLQFIDMLNEMRLGNLSDTTIQEFTKLSRPLPKDEIVPAELYSTRYEVDKANRTRLKTLPGEIKKYFAIDGGVLEDQESRERLLSNFLAPKELQLKVGAQVMLIKNMDESLVNGSLGKIIDFIDNDTFLFYERLKEEEMASQEMEEYKEDLLHKKKKDASDEPIMRLGSTIFEFLKDIKHDNDSKENFERKKQLIEDLHNSSRGRKLPLVRFLTPDGQTRTVLVHPEEWTIEDEKEQPIVSRTQLPLMLAWALSIHKSQGQTLPRVRVDLRSVFEKGQAYVALSRAVSRDGLQVLNFSSAKVFAHPKVINFYNTLKSASDAAKELQEISAPDNVKPFIARQPSILDKMIGQQTRYMSTTSRSSRAARRRK